MPLLVAVPEVVFTKPVTWPLKVPPLPLLLLPDGSPTAESPTKVTSVPRVQTLCDVVHRLDAHDRMGGAIHDVADPRAGSGIHGAVRVMLVLPACRGVQLAPLVRKRQASPCTWPPCPCNWSAAKRAASSALSWNLVLGLLWQT